MTRNYTTIAATVAASVIILKTTTGRWPCSTAALGLGLGAIDGTRLDDAPLGCYRAPVKGFRACCSKVYLPL